MMFCQIKNKKKCKKDDSIDNSLYFVESGHVDLYIPDNKQITILATLKAGEYFGNFSFFTKESRTCFARSNGFSTLLKINRDDFIEVLKNHSQDYEMFCHIKDKLLYPKEFGLVYDFCFKCEAQNHLVHQCPKLHYNVDKRILIGRQQRAQQLRDPEFYRSVLRQQGFFRKKLQIEEGFLELIDQKEELIEEFEDQFLYGNMYDVNEEDLDTQADLQSTINNQSMKLAQSLQQQQQLQLQQAQIQQQVLSQQASMPSQPSQLQNQLEKQNSASALSNGIFSRTGSRELTRRIRQRRLTQKEDADIGHSYINPIIRKKSSKLSSTQIVSSQQQQAIVLQFQQQFLNQMQQNAQKSLTSMGVIEEEKQSLTKSTATGAMNDAQFKGDSIGMIQNPKENRKQSFILTHSEKSIQSKKQISPPLPQTSQNNIIINNLNNILNLLLQGNNEASHAINNHHSFKNNYTQDIPQSTQNMSQHNQQNNNNNNNNNNDQSNNNSVHRRDSSHYHNQTHNSSKPNKQYSYNMEIDMMKLMKQYMTQGNYSNVIESLNRVFMNEIRKKRKSSFKSRAKRYNPQIPLFNTFAY